MKTTNVHEEKKGTMMDRLFSVIGEKLCIMATSPRCMFLPIYEPECPLEIIAEMADK